MNKPFNLEAFKAGQKALTREGHVATFVGICEKCENFYRLLVLIEGDDQVTSYSLNGEMHNCIGTYSVSRYDLVSMVSRHQALIDAYDPEDTWQVRSFDRSINDDFETVYGKPSFDEMFEYRLHPHNDLIKAYKKGAKIERLESGGYFVDVINPTWNEHTKYRIKPDLEFTYPIYKQSEFSGVVVEFTDLTTGKVLVDNDFYEVNYAQSTWSPHTDATQWQDWTPITKSKPTTHCLAYDAKRLDHEQTKAVRARVVKKEVAQANGWTIIKEWEV